jgi:hypothetical protein
MFWDMVENFARGYLKAAEIDAAMPLGLGRSDNERGRIERLIRQLNWAVDERLGNSIVLHFNDARGMTRNLYIDGGDDALVSFAAYSFASMPAQEVPDEIVGHLLQRNSEAAIGAWQVIFGDEENALFRLVYRALGSGLTAESFRYIGESMVTEAAAFDERLHAAGMLRL